MLYVHYLKEFLTSKCQFCYDACITPSMNDNVFVYKLFCSYTFIKSIRQLQKRIPDKTGIFVRKKEIVHVSAEWMSLYGQRNPIKGFDWRPVIGVRGRVCECACTRPTRD